MSNLIGNITFWSFTASMVDSIAAASSRVAQREISLVHMFKLLFFL